MLWLQSSRKASKITSKVPRVYSLIDLEVGGVSESFHEWPERRNGSTWVSGHDFLAWRTCSSWRMVEFIYSLTAAGNSFSSQLDSSYQDNGYCTERASRTAYPPRTKSTLLQPDRRAAVLGQPSSPLWGAASAPVAALVTGPGIVRVIVAAAVAKTEKWKQCI